MVDGDLAAQRAVDLREQRRRHVDVGDAAHVGARHPAAEVGDDAAAEAHDHVAASEVGFREPVPELDGAFEALAGLAGGQDAHERIDAGGAQPAHEHRPRRALDGLVGDDRDGGAVDQPGEAPSSSRVVTTWIW